MVASELWTHLCGKTPLKIGHKVVRQCLGIIPIRLHKALERHRPAVHAHTVKKWVPRLSLQQAHEYFNKQL